MFSKRWTTTLRQRGKSAYKGVPSKGTEKGGFKFWYI